MSKLFFILLLLFTIVPLVELEAEDCRGMTWALRTQKGDYVYIRADKNTGAYHGDTPCSEAKPILAIKVTGAERPNIEGVSYNYYNGWCRGYLAVTPPVKGSNLTSLEEANRIVESYLGSGWRMAEHHDGGGGWGCWGYQHGDIPKNTRLWVYINDQRANPWNSESSSQPVRTIVRKYPKRSSDVINLCRLKNTEVSAGSVNGNRPLNNPYYGALNLFDGGVNKFKGFNYTTWKSNKDANHWVKIKFPGPISLHKVMIEFTSANEFRPQEFALDITTSYNGVLSVEKLSSVTVKGFRVYYPLKKKINRVVEVKVIFPGPSMIEVSEIELMGVARVRGQLKIGTPKVSR